jgi:hypothetical protein
LTEIEEIDVEPMDSRPDAIWLLLMVKKVCLTLMPLLGIDKLYSLGAKGYNI